MLGNISDMDDLPGVLVVYINDQSSFKAAQRKPPTPTAKTPISKTISNISTSPITYLL